MFIEESEDDTAVLQRLANHLRGIPRLSASVGLEDADEDSWAIATGLKYIHRASTRLFQELVPALLAAEPRSSDAEKILYAIGEEYRHILYHLTATRFFRYLSGSTPEVDDR